MKVRDMRPRVVPGRTPQDESQLMIRLTEADASS
jgi:hypothetical protein